MTLATFLLVLIFFFVLYFLVTPLLSKDAAGPLREARGVEDLRYRKAEVLESLKEFDLDLQMKKISDQDYQTLYQETFAEGTKILREMDERAQEEERPPPETKPPPQETKPSPRETRTEAQEPKAPSPEIARSAVPKFCSQCGSPLETGANFCSQCGNKIKRTNA